MPETLRKMYPFFRLFLLLLLSLTLFLGGIIFSLSKIAVWGLLLGVILTPLGAILILITIDEAARRIFFPPDYKTTNCSVCGKLTFIEEGEKVAVCGYCREKEIDQVLKRKTNKV